MKEEWLPCLLVLGGYFLKILCQTLWRNSAISLSSTRNRRTEIKFWQQNYEKSYLTVVSTSRQLTVQKFHPGWVSWRKERGRAAGRAASFAWWPMCTDTAPATRSRTERNNKTQLQHLSEFSKIMQVVKAALDRRLKCSGLWKCPWKKSTSPSAIILLCGPWDKGRVVLSTLVTTDKTTKEKDFLFLCVHSTAQQRGSVSWSLLCFSWQQPSCSWEQLQEVWSPPCSYWCHGHERCSAELLTRKARLRTNPVDSSFCNPTTDIRGRADCYCLLLQLMLEQKQRCAANQCLGCWFWWAGELLPCKLSTSALEVAGRHKYWIADCQLQLLCGRISGNVNRVWKYAEEGKSAREEIYIYLNEVEEMSDNSKIWR